MDDHYKVRCKKCSHDMLRINSVTEDCDFNIFRCPHCENQIMFSDGFFSEKDKQQEYLPLPD